MERKLKVFVVVLAVLFFAGCSSVQRQHMMTEKEIYADSVLATEDGGATFLLVPIHPILNKSEMAGLVHKLFFSEKESYLGLKVYEGEMRKPFLLVKVPDEKAETLHNSQGYIASRSGQRYYCPTGTKEYGGYGQKFDPKTLPTLKDAGVRLVKAMPGSKELEDINHLKVDAAAYKAGVQQPPSKLGRAMKAGGSISSDEVMFVAASFSGGPVVAGAMIPAMKLWGVFVELYRKADTRLPFYGTAPASRQDVAEIAVDTENRMMQYVDMRLAGSGEPSAKDGTMEEYNQKKEAWIKQKSAYDEALKKYNQLYLK